MYNGVHHLQHPPSLIIVDRGPFLTCYIQWGCPSISGHCGLRSLLDLLCTMWMPHHLPALWTEVPSWLAMYNGDAPPSPSIVDWGPFLTCYIQWGFPTISYHSGLRSLLDLLCIMGMPHHCVQTRMRSDSQWQSVMGMLRSILYDWQSILGMLHPHPLCTMIDVCLYSWYMSFLWCCYPSICCQATSQFDLMNENIWRNLYFYMLHWNKHCKMDNNKLVNYNNEYIWCGKYKYR